MKTRHKYIYFFQPIDRTFYYLVRFRYKDKYIQATFGNTINKGEALGRAIKFRDEKLPKNRKLNDRALLNKPLKNKTNDLPAGISFGYNQRIINNKIYRYEYLSITAGADKYGKLIQRRVYLHHHDKLKDAISAAIIVRKQIAHEYKKEFQQ